MTTSIEYAQMASNAYAIQEDVHSEKNAILIPDGWSIIAERVNDGTGFTARAYQNTDTNEIAIAYTGTTFEGNTLDKAKDWLFANIPAGTGVILAPQVVDAAKFYLDVLQANPSMSGAISFTGHSLGGGLASLMAVYFDRHATVFDEAPFEKSADSLLVVNLLKNSLIWDGYLLPSAFVDYTPLYPLSGVIDAYFMRESRDNNVTHYYVRDEILSLTQTQLGQLILAGLLQPNTQTIVGEQYFFESNATTGNGWGEGWDWLGLNGNPVDLHSMVLLDAFLMSPDFLKASQNHPELLQALFTSEFNFELDLPQANLLSLFVRRQIAGEKPLEALATDLTQLKGDLAGESFKFTLVDLALRLHYAQGVNREEGNASGVFQQVYTSLDGGIQITRNPAHEEWTVHSFANLEVWLRGQADLGAYSLAGIERYSLSDGRGMYARTPDDARNDFMLGGANTDILLGGKGTDILIGGAGNDNLVAEYGHDTLIGDEGNDYLWSVDGGHILFGGIGDDTYHAKFGDTITDTDGLGAVKLGDKLVTGGTWDAELNAWVGTNGITYTQVGNKLFIKDMANPTEAPLVINEFVQNQFGKEHGSLGINLDGSSIYEKFAIPLRAGIATAQFTPSRRLTDPLVLDLNGDGIETIGTATPATTTTAGVYFDHAADGFAENTGWVGSADGLLVRDLNGNGTIDSGRELFGDQTLLANGALATNGFTALAGLDSNLDGKVDAADAGFSELRVWQDANSDGLTDAGELHTLAELGIVSLNTGYTSPNTNLGNGNVLAQAGTYLKEDGSVGNSGSLLFDRNSTDSIATEWLTVPMAVQALPDLAGFGVVHDLHQAMARNTGLAGMVQALADLPADTSLLSYRLQFQTMLHEWTGSNTAVAGSRGTFVDASRLKVLEQFLGDEFWGVSGTNPNNVAGPQLEALYAKLFDEMFYRFVAQAQLKPLLAEANATFIESGTLALDLSSVASYLAEVGQLNPGKAQGQLFLLIKSAGFLGLNQMIGWDTLQTELEAISDEVSGPSMHLAEIATYLLANPNATLVVGGISADTLTSGSATLPALLSGQSGNDTLTGSSASDVLLGGDGNDTLDGGTGKDYLYGGAGNDILGGAVGSVDAGYYAYGNPGPGAGNIYEGGLGNDTLRGTSLADIYRFHLGDGDSITFKNWYDLDSTIANSSQTPDPDPLSGATPNTEAVALPTVNPELKLQVLTEGFTEGLSPSGNPLVPNPVGSEPSLDPLVGLTHKVESFNFNEVVAQFDEAQALDPTLMVWDAHDSLMDFYLGGSDTHADGGAFAYNYGHEGDLTGLALATAQTSLSEIGISSPFDQPDIALLGLAPATWDLFLG